MLEPDHIYDLETGNTIKEAGLIKHLAAADVVFIGEMHNHPEQHRRQVRILDGLRLMDGNLVIGLELFPRTEQGLLDQWLAGAISEKIFVDRVIEKVMGPGTLRVYLPLLDWARCHGIPLLALNAPRSATSRVAGKGLDALDRAARKNVAGEIIVGPDEYRRRVAHALERHHHMINPEFFFQAQVTWDETMAENTG